MDKNKVIEAAAKLVAKGAFDKAIKEYQKVLEADPRDVRVLQKMGELYQKKNENAQAAHYFTKVAESYSNDGFFLKAVALYKQVLKLNPALMEVNLKLADLHQQLGLMSEATTYFQVVANHHEKAGDVRASLATLKKMVDLDPENVGSRIKLGDLYSREGMTKEAAAELKRAADDLGRTGRVDDALRVQERLAALEPENVALNRDLAVAYLQRGDQKRALARLQVCFKADARDVETLQLLAQAFEGLGQVAKTVSVYKELAKVYAERGMGTQAEGVWARIQLLDPQDPDLRARQQSAAPAPKPAPARPSAPAPAPAPARAAPAPAAPAPAPAPASRDQLAKVLTETDVYVKYGLHDKALEHLRKVFAVDPENLDAHEKAYQIYVAANHPAQAAEQLLNVLRLCTRRADVKRAQPYLATILQTDPGHPEVPAFLAVLRTEAGEEEAVADDAILVMSGEEDDVLVGEPPADALGHLTMADVARAQSTRASAGGRGRGPAVLEEPDLVSDAADTYGEDTYGEDDTFHAVVDDEPLPGDGGGEDDVFALARESAQHEDTGELELGGPGDDEAQVLESGEFELEDDVPGGAPAAEPEDGMAAALAAGAARFGAEAEPEALADGGEEEPAGEELDEAEFFLDQGLLEEALEVLETVAIAFPGHRRAARLRARLDALQSGGDVPAAFPGAPAARAQEPDAFDLAQELASGFDALAEASPQSSPDDFQYSVEEVFNEFKKGLEKVVKPEDVDTHYDLGIAYKEMGLTDDAISEFLVAQKGCAGKKKEVDCLTMVALLQRERGDHGAAVAAYKEALASEHAAGEVLKALLFELGTTYEAMGRPGKALFHLQRVAQLDGAYREVGGLVARLQAQAAPEPDELPRRGGPGAAAAGAAPTRPGAAAASRKVGYV